LKRLPSGGGESLPPPGGPSQPESTGRIAVDEARQAGGAANRQRLDPFKFRRPVLNPLATARQIACSRPHFDPATAAVHTHHPA